MSSSSIGLLASCATSMSACSACALIPSVCIKVFLPRPTRGARVQDNSSLLLGEFGAEDRYPWFGEMALVSNRPREATAASREPTTLLALPAARFTEFLQIVPDFSKIFATSVSSYTTLNRLNRTIKQEKGEVRAHRMRTSLQSPSRLPIVLRATHRSLSIGCFVHMSCPIGAKACTATSQTQGADMGRKGRSRCCARGGSVRSERHGGGPGGSDCSACSKERRAQRAELTAPRS